MSRTCRNAIHLAAVRCENSACLATTHQRFSGLLRKGAELAELGGSLAQTLHAPAGPRQPLQEAASSHACHRTPGLAIRARRQPGPTRERAPVRPGRHRARPRAPPPPPRIPAAQGSPVARQRLPHGRMVACPRSPVLPGLWTPLGRRPRHTHSGRQHSQRSSSPHICILRTHGKLLAAAPHAACCRDPAETLLRPCLEEGVRERQLVHATQARVGRELGVDVEEHGHVHRLACAARRAGARAQRGARRAVGPGSALARLAALPFPTLHTRAVAQGAHAMVPAGQGTGSYLRQGRAQLLCTQQARRASSLRRVTFPVCGSRRRRAASRARGARRARAHAAPSLDTGWRELCGRSRRLPATQVRGSRARRGPARARLAAASAPQSRSTGSC
jgi:hypothetical protein